MGTRSLVHVKNESGQTLVSMYRQFDGYPSGMGQDIFNALNGGKVRVCNGFSGNDQNPKVFNGMGCLAAHLVGALKTPTNDPDQKTNSIGNVYIVNLNASNSGEEYVYTLSMKANKVMIEVVKVYGDIVLYNGPLASFNPEEAGKVA